jgi:Type VI secretion system (T6SS), amidase effector protein 4
MAYAKIRLNFETMRGAYKHNKELPADIAKWLKAQNEAEDKVNARNEEHKARGEKLEPGGGHSTSCCMQASLSFNATSQPIPKAGSRDRDNTTLDNGKNYILAVDEFRAYLTYKYGPTDTFKDKAAIKGMTGVIIFGNGHIELWDGDDILQKPGTAGAMDPGWVWSQKPMWFWEITDAAAATQGTPGAVPDWQLGWWTVWDGSYYYYYFFDDGHVVWIEEKPNPKWVPRKNIGNSGTFTQTEHGLKIVWRPTEPGGKPTIEDFTRRDWSSTNEMNGNSNKYSPLVAKKM